MTHHTRREFLRTGSFALAGLELGVQSLDARGLRSKRPFATLFPAITDPEELRVFARHALEVAEREGATYADIRIMEKRTFRIGYWTDVGMIELSHAYGLRVFHQGRWSCVGGHDLTSNGVARAARQAVRTAQSLGPSSGNAPTLWPVPPVRGEWHTPVQIDPFSLAPDEIAGITQVIMDAAGRRRDIKVGIGVGCAQMTRVFASTEGSLITQRLVESDIGANTAKEAPTFYESDILLPVRGIAGGNGGFELIDPKPEWAEWIKATADEVLRIASLPTVGQLEVGRFPGVVSGDALRAFVGQTLLPSLAIERVLGHEADSVGTSFLAPLRETLGARLFSPALSVSAQLEPNGRRWDDEGVVPRAFPLIEDGRVVDCLTTRSTARELSEWYNQQRTTPGPRGTALSSQGRGVDAPPQSGAERIHVAPNPRRLSLDDLIRSVPRGIYLYSTIPGGIASDQQLLGGLMRKVPGLEIRDGKIARRIRRLNMHFRTQAFWKKMTAVGDSSTLESASNGTAPAVRVEELDVVHIPDADFWKNP